MLGVIKQKQQQQQDNAGGENWEDTAGHARATLVSSLWRSKDKT